MEQQRDWREIRAGLGEVLKRLAGFEKFKPDNPEFLDQANAALKALPPGDTLGQAVEEFRAQAEQYVAAVRQERVRAFRRIEADFIRSAREQEKITREVSAGWRIGALMLEIDREHARARALYNHEPLGKWASIKDVEGLEDLVAKTNAALEKGQLPEELLIKAFWEGYKQGRELKQGPNKPLLPILDFYRGLRTALVLLELRGQKPEKRLVHGELPRWAFLYNVDRYRSLGEKVPPEYRLGFQTGTQSVVASGNCVTINGLEAHLEYKKVCYIVPVDWSGS